MKGQPTKLALRKEGFLAEVPLADVAPASQKALDFLLAHAVGGFAPDNGDAIMLLQAASLFSTRDLVVPTSVEIKFRAPHAIDAMLSP